MAKSAPVPISAQRNRLWLRRGFRPRTAPQPYRSHDPVYPSAGEEDAALRMHGEKSFSDVPAWADRYAAYAHQQGYSNGVGDGKFGTALMISPPRNTLEFILRALGYSSTSHTDLSTTLNDARTAGVLTSGEYNSPAFHKTPLRAHLVYISPIMRFHTYGERKQYAGRPADPRQRVLPLPLLTTRKSWSPRPGSDKIDKNDQKNQPCVLPFGCTQGWFFALQHSLHFIGRGIFPLSPASAFCGR